MTSFWREFLGPTFFGYQRPWQKVIYVAWLPLVAILLLIGQVFPAVFSLRYSGIVEFVAFLVFVLPALFLWIGALPFAPAIRLSYRKVADILGAIGIGLVLITVVLSFLEKQEPKWLGDHFAFAALGIFCLIFSSYFYRRCMVRSDDELR